MRVNLARLRKGPKSERPHRSDGMTDTATCIDDLDDWKSSIDCCSEAGDRESVLAVEDRGRDGSIPHHAWHCSADVLPYKPGCALLVRSTSCAQPLLLPCIAPILRMCPGNGKHAQSISEPPHPSAQHSSAAIMQR